ncbi:MAG TPA: glycosyltransferase N-terminal domain-containing protein [Saprospiraceae bacterium]|nr:glycosyltransferase N-terminal domain-containing protein [Saprospiraceae bacterium]HPI08268.1 glycosyltransferase N-terminal domain-containing protein [Saprospiraceae bacterium]
MGIWRLLYDAAIALFVLLTRIAAVFDEKARLWVNGRRNWRTTLRQAAPEHSGATLWVHAASLGEFEQGRPVIEAVRAQFPGRRIVLTFFSPSGFEIRKNYPHADLVCYLPADTRRNAIDFLDIIRPDVAVFVKYEFWANYLFELKKRQIPVLLVSALFREKQPFFKWYGAFWRDMLGCFTRFFVQNKLSENLLQNIGFQNVTVAGDTRVDRVLHLAAQAPENEVVAAFQKSPLTGETLPLLIAGSTWPADEAILTEVMRKDGPEDWKWVFAPHDPSPAAIARLLALCPKEEMGEVLLYSKANASNATAASTLLIDNVGLLNTLYRYGHVAYIGGGLGKGIHNTLEPAAFGLPVIFGPKYEKFEEARQFVARGGAFVVHNAAELKALLHQFKDPVFYENAYRAVLTYLEESRGATHLILAFFQRHIKTGKIIG